MPRPGRTYTGAGIAKSARKATSASAAPVSAELLIDIVGCWECPAFDQGDELQGSACRIGHARAALATSMVRMNRQRWRRALLNQDELERAVRGRPSWCPLPAHVQVEGGPGLRKNV